MFSVDRSELKKFQALLKKAPGKMKWAVREVANSQAFAARVLYPEELNRSMTVRSKGFVKSSFRVLKADSSGTAYTGSVKRDRFTGWAEQLIGKKTDRTRVPTLAARGGSFQRKITGSARMRSNNKFKKRQHYRARSPAASARRMVAVLRNTRHTKPFIIKGHNNAPDGLYRIKSKRLVMLQNFESDGVQPKRDEFMQRANRRMDKEFNVRRAWANAFKKVFPYR